MSLWAQRADSAIVAEGYDGRERPFRAEVMSFCGGFFVATRLRMTGYVQPRAIQGTDIQLRLC